MTLALSNGTTQIVTDANNTSFLGFIANPGTVFTSLSVTSNDPTAYFSAVNNLRVGQAATPIPTPALLPGLIGLGLSVWRKRKAAAAEMDSEA